MRIISSIYLLAFAFLLFSKNEFNERRIESHEFKGEKSVKSKFKAVSNVEFYSTIPLRESPYPDVIGVVRLTAEESSERNHYRFEYDNNFQLVSVSIRLGDKLINPNHTSNYFFTTPEQRFTYKGNKEIRTFYDKFGNQVTQRDAFKEIYTLDQNGRYKTLYFEDENGERTENSWGIYEYLWEQQIDGSVIENRINRSGEPVALRPGFEFYSIRLYYEHNGVLALMQNIDSVGNLVENRTGVAQDKLHFDKKGRWLGWTVLDANNNIKRGNGPNVAQGINETDKYGYERSIRYEDVDGTEIRNSHGFWGSKRFYDKYGNYDYTQFVDKEGLPAINEKTGYSIAKYTWSKDGLNRKKVELLDVDKNPVLHKTRGYAAIKQDYNELGNVIKTSFLGLKGELINRKDNNIAYITYSYNEANKLMTTKRYRSDGSEIK